MPWQSSAESVSLTDPVFYSRDCTTPITVTSYKVWMTSMTPSAASSLVTF